MTPALAALFGLAFGSFANAAIDRIPRRMPLSGRSHCDSCGATLAPRHLIPVLSYLVQRGRCAACAAPIGVRTPLVELASAAAFTAAFVTFPPAVAAVTCGAALALAVAAGTLIMKRGLTS